MLRPGLLPRRGGRGESNFFSTRTGDLFLFPFFDFLGGDSEQPLLLLLLGGLTLLRLLWEEEWRYFLERFFGEGDFSRSDGVLYPLEKDDERLCSFCLGGMSGPTLAGGWSSSTSIASSEDSIT